MGQNLILDLTLPFCITVDMFECLFFTKNNKEKTVNQINQKFRYGMSCQIHSAVAKIK